MRARELVVAIVVPVFVACVSLVGTTSPPPDQADAASDGSPPSDAAQNAVADGASNDASEGGGTASFPPPCDPTFPLGEVQCSPSNPRPACATKTALFPSYPAGHARDVDLVTCSSGAATPTCVQHCPFGCATMPNGYADFCDDCNGRPDGVYCAKDLRGVDARNEGLAVECTGGKTTRAFLCGIGLCATVCPREDAKPSCCI